jgi:hypothetical protein
MSDLLIRIYEEEMDKTKKKKNPPPEKERDFSRFNAYNFDKSLAPYRVSRNNPM